MGLVTFERRGMFGIECDWQNLPYEAKAWVEDGEHDLIWYVPCHRILEAGADGSAHQYSSIRSSTWQGALMFANKPDAVYFRMTWL